MDTPIDEDLLLTTLDLFQQGMTEIRLWQSGVDKKKRTEIAYRGFFDDPNKAVAQVKKWDSNDATVGIFVVLNEIKAGSFQPENTIQRGKSTRDIDISRRRWLPIDIDPKRAAGIMATDEERAMAEKAATFVRDYLTDQGFPAPVYVDSGNGYHLLYRIDMENTSDSKNLIRDFLKQLNETLPDEIKMGAEVDESVHNASRVIKLPGTVVRKKSLDGRPWRRSRLLDLPDHVEVVQEDQIGAIIERPIAKDAKQITLDQKIRACMKDLIMQGVFDDGRASWNHSTCLAIMAELLASGYSDEAICTVFDQAFEESFNESITRQQITQARATYIADGGTFWTCRELQKSGVISPETCAKCGADKTTGFTKNDFGRYTKDGKYQFSRNKAASSLLREMHIEAKKNDKILRWFDGEIYQDTGESKIADTLYTTCQNYVNRGGVNEVIDRVRVNRQLCPAMFNQDPYIMPLQDQVIDLRTGEARPFRAEDLLTFKYEAQWDVDNADWKHFLWFLCSSLPDPLDVLTALDMVVAAAIRLPFNIMAQLIGGGSNGKGVYEKVMLAFYGEERASALSLSELKKSRFGVGALFDVDLWIISEVEGVKDAINALKKIATGEFTDSDSKYGGRIKGRPHALTILDSNDAFDFGDDSYGRKRRTPKLDFCYTFGDEDGMRPIDEALEETLKTQESLAGIAKIVTARAPDLIASKRIFYTKSTEEREAGYDRQRFSVKYFIDECIGEEAPSEGAVLITRKTDKQKIPDGGASLYDSYLEYCKLFHVPTPSNSNQLGTYIGKRFEIKSKVTSHKGASVRLYPGLFLTKSPNEAYGDFVNNHLPTTPNYSRTTLKLQKGGIRIDIRKYFASENYSNYSSLMISVIEEIARMYSFISSRKDEKEIEYEKYLEFSVVSVVSVVDGRSIAVSCDGDCSSSVVSCDDTCSLGVTEDTNVEIDGPDKMPSTSKREMGIPVDMVNISRENGGRVSLADCRRAGVMNAREKLDELVETEGWTTTTTKGGLITWTPPKMRVLSTIEDIKPFVETDGKTWALCRGDLMTTCPGISYTRAKALVKEGAARWVI